MQPHPRAGNSWVHWVTHPASGRVYCPPVPEDSTGQWEHRALWDHEAAARQHRGKEAAQGTGRVALLFPLASSQCFLKEAGWPRRKVAFRF